jgi:ADP-ribose pyrophosphatase
MKLLATIGSQDNNIEKYRTRSSVRTVLVDDTNKVAILYVNEHNYYKIPGGGVEEGETPEEAAVREALEESGCNCTISKLLGKTISYINEWDSIDHSVGYIARATGAKSDPRFDAWELERNFELIWVDNLDTAIEIFEGSTTANSGGRVMQERDLLFLKTARDVLN